MAAKILTGTGPSGMKSSCNLCPKDERVSSAIHDGTVYRPSHHPFLYSLTDMSAIPRWARTPYTNVSDILTMPANSSRRLRMPWYKNTLFVITADHTNQVTYTMIPDRRKTVFHSILPYPSQQQSERGERPDSLPSRHHAECAGLSQLMTNPTLPLAMILLTNHQTRRICSEL